MEILKVLREIDRLKGIDWNNEEFIPYNIDKDMTSQEIETHLLENQVEDIKNDLNIK